MDASGNLSVGATIDVRFGGSDVATNCALLGCFETAERRVYRPPIVFHGDMENDDVHHRLWRKHAPEEPSTGPKT
jgi:hypothetical protein